MSAINPSLLFSEQQREQARLQTRQNAPVNGRASGSNDINEEGSEGGMAVDDDDSKPNGEAEATVEETQAVEDETEPLNLKDDAVLAAFLAKMDDYEPILPNPVTRYYLERAGFQSNDDRVTKLLGLAAQKFVSDVAADAFAFARTRTMTGPGRAPGAGNASGQTGSSKQRDRTRTTLTMEDLAAAMNEYGIDASRAPYYR